MAAKSGFVEITFDVGVISCYIIKVRLHATICRGDFAHVV